MYALDKGFLSVIKVKLSIVYTIHGEENSISLAIFLWMSNIFIIGKPSIFGTTKMMTAQKLIMLSLLI